tara:strand:- start:191 stop:454 length:264 start_codon:yes stop_codon:yes gene_type:complete
MNDPHTVLIWEGALYQPLKLVRRIVVTAHRDNILQRFRMNRTIDGDDYEGDDHPAFGTVLKDWSEYDLNGYSLIDVDKAVSTHLWIS